MATVTKRNNSYEIRVSCGYDLSGKQVRVSKTWTPPPNLTQKQTEKELARQVVLFEEQVRTGQFINNNIKFETLAKQWLQQVELEGNLKPLTINKYKQMQERTYKAIGHLKITEINRIHIQRFINSLTKDGVNQLTKGGLSTKSQKGYLGFVSNVMNYAIDCNIIIDNPCHNVHTIKTESRERVVFTLEESQLFLEKLEQAEPRYKAMFTLALYSGFRHGELLGLKWDDIDFDTCVITINRIALYTKEKGHFFGEPKTKSSQRSLKLPQVILDMLAEYKKQQAVYRLALGDKWQNNNLVFPNDFGAIMHQSISRRWLQEFCIKNDLPVVTVHGLRHANASLLISSGADVKTVSSTLGHSQTSTTLDIYAHSFALKQAEASQAVAELLTPSKRA